MLKRLDLTIPSYLKVRSFGGTATGKFKNKLEEYYES